jgi:hypothetical protein
MTIRCELSIPRRDTPELCKSNNLENEGVGNAGCPLHPQPRAQSVKSTRVILVTAGPPGHPAFPHAMVLTAYFVLFPVTGLDCHRRQRMKTCLNPVGPTDLRKLDASVGAPEPHDFAVRFSTVRQRVVDRSQADETCPAISLHARRCLRPPHPIPTSVTIAIRPSWGTAWRDFYR